MDFGLDKFIEMFEARFGRKPTTAFMVLIGVGIASVMIHLTWDNLVRPIFHFFQEINLSGLTGAVNGSFLSNAVNLGGSILLAALALHIILMATYFIFGFWKSIIDDYLRDRKWKKKYNEELAQMNARALGSTAKAIPVSPPPIPAQPAPPGKT